MLSVKKTKPYSQIAAETEAPRVKGMHLGAAIVLLSNVIVVGIMFTPKITHGWSVNVLHQVVPDLPCLLLVVISSCVSILWHLGMILFSNRLVPYFPPFIQDRWIMLSVVMAIDITVLCVVIQLNEVFSIISLLFSVETTLYYLYIHEKSAAPLYKKLKQIWIYYLYPFVALLVILILNQTNNPFILVSFAMTFLMMMLSLLMPTVKSLPLQYEPVFIIGISVFQITYLWMFALL